MARPLVLKVGGSLFDWPELPGRLLAVLDEYRADCGPLVIVAGGGRAADFVRNLDRTFALGDVPAHRLAIRALDLTAHALAALLPGLEVVADLAVLPGAWERGRIPVLVPRRFLDEDERRAADPLAPSWAVTSDAIAARLAVRLDASELVLLKSAPLPPGVGRREAARLGLVDPAFPDASRSLGRVSYLNLRVSWRAILLPAP